jgi:cell division protein FtsI/penicillin-binding protein 2
MNKRAKSITNLQNKRRMLVFLACFFLVTLALVVRLGYIQLIKGEEYRKQAMENWSREEWGWNPKYDLDSMTKDMLEKLRIKLNIQD